MDPVRQVAQAVLYEGYLLWPYRRSALKNQRRWTFGGVYPEAYSTARGGGDPWTMRTQCLLEPDGEPDGQPGAEAGDKAGGTGGEAGGGVGGGGAGGGGAGGGCSVDVSVRFLHVVRRSVGRWRGGELEAVDELTVGGERHLAWQEATERQVDIPGLRLAELLRAPYRHEIDIPAGQTVEWLTDQGGRAGAVVRAWEALRGWVETRAERAGPTAARLTVTIANTTPLAGEGEGRDQAVERAMVSTHTVLRSTGGRFVSLTDPPPALRSQAAACDNAGTWPVLVGAEGERHTLLSSPIILYDYPKVAPESPGDLFDATEIDQLLTLSTLALTEEEQRELRAGDPRARELLDRCLSLAPEQLMRLHGTFREVRALPPDAEGVPT